MRKLVLAAAVMLAAQGVLAAEEAAPVDVSRCTFPEEMPQIPDGASATREQMTEAQGDVQTFVQAGQKSLQCLAEVEKSLGEEITEEQQQQLVAIHNERFDKLSTVASEFNEQLKVYNAR